MRFIKIFVIGIFVLAFSANDAYAASCTAANWSGIPAIVDSNTDITFSMNLVASTNRFVTWSVDSKACGAVDTTLLSQNKIKVNSGAAGVHTMKFIVANDKACYPGQTSNDTPATCPDVATWTSVDVTYTLTADGQTGTVQLPAGTSDTHLAFNITSRSGNTGQVYVSDNGQPEAGPVVQGASGAADPGGLLPGHTYVYTLYKGTAHAEAAASVTVVGGSTVSPSLTPVSNGNTVSFKISETVAGLATATEQPYVLDSNGNLMTSFTFQNLTPGAKFIFVSFKDSNGKWGGCGINKDQPCSVQTELILTPEIGSCTLDTSNPSQITFTIVPGNGHSFGEKTGKVEVGDVSLQSLKLDRWDPNLIKAVYSGQPTDQSFQIKVTDANNSSITGTCSSLSQLSVSAKLFCNSPQSAGVGNVDLTIVEAKAGAKPIKQTVRVDPTGAILGLQAKLVQNLGYKISIKAPKSLRKTTEFYVNSTGTTQLSNFKLAIGDIYPEEGDGVINTADRQELVRQWRLISGSGNRSGDFNGDGLVNSFDYACLQHGRGGEDPEPVGGPIKASPNPAASVTTS